MESKYLQDGLTFPPVELKDPLWLTASSNTPTNATLPRSSALSNKLTAVLSASYTDPEIRDALETLDRRGVKNTAETRRRLRLNLQREVIECNGDVIKDFGAVAEVRSFTSGMVWI